MKPVAASRWEGGDSRAFTPPAEVEELPSGHRNEQCAWVDGHYRWEGRGFSWQPGRWVLVVEDLNGQEREVFRLGDSYATVGRRSDDPQLRTTVALSDVPHVSRRQLALLWEERDGAPGFKVYNLGLNPLHLPGREIRGAHVGKGALDLDAVPGDATGWVRPGVPVRIGDQGPVLRIDEVPPDAEEGAEEVEVDPDATRHE